MTKLLQEAFEKAAALSDDLQDQLAKEMLEMLEEFSYSESLKQSLAKGHEDAKHKKGRFIE